MNNPPLAPLDIYKVLPKTNCGRCLLPSCLAFAAAVAAGQKKIRACPWLEPSQVAAFQSEEPSTLDVTAAGQAEFVDRLKAKTARLDFSRIALQVGGSMQGDRLCLNSLGKEFCVDRHGNLVSECHIISWVQIPLLAYITNETPQEVTGRWISFREVKGGIEWQGLFTSRCETPLRKLADANQGLLTDLIDLFQGARVDWYEADIALILRPLPKVPILICYQAPEDDLDSVLTIFFDECCQQNLHVKALFTLCSGLVQMFSKIAERHL